MRVRRRGSGRPWRRASNEPKSVLDLYGPNATKPGTFAHSALLARRLVERGVRVVQIYSGSSQCGGAWDAHSGLDAGHRKCARSIDRPFYDRAMVLQAWGTYGTLWPVVHQQLGVRPDMGRGRLEVTPQVPDGQSSIAGSNVRLANGAVDVVASHSGDTYSTKVSLGVPLSGFTIGLTLPRGSRVDQVTLDGAPVSFTKVPSNRGLEVLAAAPTSGTHELVVTAR